MKKIKTEMKTIAQQLNVKVFPLIVTGPTGNDIYYEDSDGYWVKWEHDSRGNQIYHENSNGFWIKREFDSEDRVICYETSDGVIMDNQK